MLTKHCVTSGFMKMHFLSSSQTLKKQKPLQIRSENAFFEIQPNAKKTKTTADPQRKCIFSVPAKRSRFRCKLTKHCVTSGFMKMHLGEIPGLRMLTKHCVTSGFMHFLSSSQTLKKQKPLQIRSENAFFQFQPGTLGEPRMTSPRRAQLRYK